MNNTMILWWFIFYQNCTDFLEISCVATHIGWGKVTYWKLANLSQISSSKTKEFRYLTLPNSIYVNLTALPHRSSSFHIGIIKILRFSIFRGSTLRRRALKFGTNTLGNILYCLPIVCKPKLNCSPPQELKLSYWHN